LFAFFKTIPDTTSDDACRRLLYLLEQLDEKQKATIKKLSLKYTPQVIVLLDAMLETLNPKRRYRCFNKCFESTNVL
jgi:hypothetical protein